MKLLIALYHRFASWTAPDWFSERLQRDFPGLRVVQLPNYQGIDDEIADADIAIAWSLRGEQIARARRLRWIHSTAAAVHALMSSELRASDIVVTNARAVHGPVVAEHALALMFAMAKRLPQAALFQSQKHWAQREIGALQTRELRESTVTIVGMGTIGSELARLAKALGMRVIGVRRNPVRGGNSADEVYAFHEINQALAEGDFLVLAAPVTEQTRHMMNAERFRLLKPTAYVINVSRGVLMDENALVTALAEERFAGAALDVTEHEPLLPDSPLWTHEKVFITPHIGGYAQKMWERHYKIYAQNLQRYLAGQPLLWTVDKQAGY